MRTRIMIRQRAHPISGEELQPQMGYSVTSIGTADFQDTDRGIEVVTVLEGTVTDVRDGNFDRHQAVDPGAKFNFVYVDHGNGWVSEYFALRRGLVNG